MSYSRTFAGTALSFLIVVAVGGCCRPHVPCCAAAPAPVAAVRAPEPDQVFLDATILQVPAASLADYAPPGAAAVLSRTDADALLARATTDPQAKVVAAPKILALSGNVATVFVGETLADGTWTGWRMRFVPVLAPDASALSLSASIGLRPTPADGEAVDPAAIRAKERSARAEVASMKPGEALRFTIPSVTPQDDPMVVLVRAQVIRAASRAQP